MSKFLHFELSEFKCPHCGQQHMNIPFVKKLDAARGSANTPFKINSGWRCHAHNSDIGGKDNSAHLYGVAADIEAIYSRPRYQILSALFFVGFHRIGIAETFIHVDDDETKDPEVVWLY